MNNRYKNNLAKILKEKKLSKTRLSKETGISRQTISKISKDKFYGMNVHTLTTLLSYFDVGINEFGTIYNQAKYVDERISKVSFNTVNLALLDRLLTRKLELAFIYSPYHSNKCLNFYSKKYSNQFSFSGNIRISFNSREYTFEVIDFDLWKISEKVNFEDFFDFYHTFIFILEDYATQMKFDKMVINVSPYIDSDLKGIIPPRVVNHQDLKMLVQELPYDARTNELVKFAILKSLRYGVKERDGNESLTNLLDNQVDSMYHFTFLEKEKIRFKRMEEQSISSRFYTKKYVKYI